MQCACPGIRATDELCPTKTMRVSPQDLPFINAELRSLNKVDDLKDAKTGKAFGVLKAMGAQPGDCQDDLSFSLPNHQQLNLDDQQCAERIAEHFAEISGQFPPLNLNLLPDRVRNVLDDDSTPPIISEYDCYLKMKATKKPKSVIPGDLPSDIV